MNTLRVHEAFKAGDLKALKAAAGDPAEFPNCKAPFMSSQCLEYAIYHSPLHFIQVLLDLGADPNYGEHEGFPSILAALSTDREDKYVIIQALVSSGADVNQRGINDYTPLHYAVAQNDPKAVELILSHGADRTARTRIDHYATALEEGEILGRDEAVQVLRKLTR
ncbi:MAG: ankyrin repeat domain-containing protein [Acidobacteriia bacterium]|nr:ankyrin repeat domain-containing protein [Terriglobia bacterium]